MIRKTLRETQHATYAVELPDGSFHGMPRPVGTGFFVSNDGWFVTAAHVVTENGMPNGKVRQDIDQCWLTKETPPGEFSKGMCQFVSFDYIDPSTDFALLKVDFSKNSEKTQLVGLTGFPFLRVSSRVLEEGELVYAFGYPLSNAHKLVDDENIKIGHASITPRTTSAIVASVMDTSRHFSSSNDPQVYVLDKALNYGNSGGPIIAADTGCVSALCSRFQPFSMPQPHLGAGVTIVIPSLYGVVSRLSNPSVLQVLAQRGVTIFED